MKRFSGIFILLLSFLVVVSCAREEIDKPHESRLPEGSPVTLCINFGANDFLDVNVGTKASSNRADEARVHDLYVMIFDASGNRFYNRFFSYEHLEKTDRATLLSQPNEGWYVDNVTLSDLSTPANSSKQTRGVVKISTESHSGSTLVLIANLQNTVTNLDDNSDPINYLASITTLDALKQVKVHLEQDVMNRNDLFLMLGLGKGWDTGDMAWDKNSVNGSSTGEYGSQYRVELKPLDAKVKFRIRANSMYIESVNPRLWWVYRVPERAMLYPDDGSGNEVAFQDGWFFDTDSNGFYFEGAETDEAGTWQVFSFYMLQNRQTCLYPVSDYTEPSSPRYGGSTPDITNLYYCRELQEKENDDNHEGYKKNGEWVFARPNATYVKFDLILTLKREGIDEIKTGIAEALTTDAVFTVHLGDFSNSGNDDYNTKRGVSYIYNVVVNNSKKIYVEVRGDNDDNGKKKEQQPGQEGSLLLTTAGIINCDAHYEYHSMEFTYDPDLGKPGSDQNDPWENRRKFSWYVKTAFNPDGMAPNFNNTTGWYEMPANCDCRWVKFALNDKDEISGNYLSTRRKYPGDDCYNSAWTPASGVSAPTLMDINQLVNFLFQQSEKKYAANPNDPSAFDATGKLRVTAFVDEYYYERDPFSNELDPNLWRTFVNAKPREIHILSDSEHSLDRQSDVITSSHSIIQQSIQTIYNKYAPDLSSLWGTEHNDKIHKGAEDAGWPWWPGSSRPAGTILYNDDENGRLNTAGLWGLSSGLELRWDQFLDYEVDNDMPELKSDYQYLAYACMSRNRDNNGNGVIDVNELRWYTASINQLVGMWVGNESLTQTSRLYQPKDGTSTTNSLLWRSEIASSTCSDITSPLIIRAQEGATKSDYSFYSFWTSNPADRDKITSVRCLRNIGTYRDRGVSKDISEAPYDQMFDQYFDFEKGVDGDGKAWPNEDGSYTVRFSRLNSKSIREYTAEDLPYHDEYSPHNCVYLRFTAQPSNLFRDDDHKDNGNAYPKILDDLNNEISVHNDYCPEGYRLPNMTELLLMVAVLPSDYWGSDKKVIFPSRSYFSRGKLGSLKTSSESEKIGWGFSKDTYRMHLVHSNSSGGIKGVRCVRDDNMVGDITGKLMIADSEHQRVGQAMDIEMNFSSMGSAIREVVLTLEYIDSDGDEHTVEVPYTLSSSSTTLQEHVKYMIPNLPARGQMTLKASVLNYAGISREFTASFILESDLKLSLKLLPCEYNASAEMAAQGKIPFPILLTAYDGIAEDITSWQIRVAIQPDNSSLVINQLITDVPLPDYQSIPTTYASTIYDYNPYDGTSLQEGTYTFQLEATVNGTVTRSEVVSMRVLKANFDPMADFNFSNLHEASDISSYTWAREVVNGLDFASGDFIEADMDVSRCVYIPVPNSSNPNKDRSVGLDNILSIGLTDINWSQYMFPIYYPAISTGDPWLYFAPTWADEGSIGYRGWTYALFHETQPLHIRLDKDGVFWNAQIVDYTKWPAEYQAGVKACLNKLTAASTLYVGSDEDGAHRSRAKYRFVRVVYNERDSAIKGGDSKFKDNPGYGGDL